MPLLDLLRFILVLILSAALLFDFPVPLRTFVTETSGVGVDESLSTGIPWIDSDLPENVTVHSKKDPREDFHLYANRDLILDKKYREGYYMWTNYSEASSAVDERAMKLMKNLKPDDHYEELVKDLYDTLTGWDKRDETGFAEIKELTDPVLEAKDLNELTEYLFTDDALIFLVNFITVYVSNSYNDSKHYSVCIDPEGLLLDDSAEYKNRTEFGDMTASYNEKMFVYYAGRLGMKEDEAKKMLEQAYDLEEELSQSIPTSEEMMNDNYVERANNEMSFKDLEDLSGNFPLAELIEVQDLKYDGKYVVSEPDYLKLLNEVYVEDNFEAIRSIVYVNALLDLGEYTDRDAYDYELDTSNECYGTDYWYTDEENAYYTMQDMFSEPLQKIYVEKYGSEEDKQRLEDLCEEVIDCYREMLSENTWASAETIDYAIKKLDAMDINVAYPDKWTDYSELSLDGCSMLEAERRIMTFYDKYNDSLAGKEVNHECWAADVNILDCNAYYSCPENAIYICLGMMEKPFYYEDMSTEELYASIAGFWVGHEISHSFDANGARYDADGNLRDWWSEEDKKEFRARIDKLDAYLDTIKPFGNYSVNGKNIDTEMLADITGLQCALRMVSDMKDFDYDVFFTKFANMNVEISYYSIELSTLLQDSHPLSYLRTNVSVQQFDEFYETYGVKEGDNMYLSPGSRVTVW